MATAGPRLQLLKDCYSAALGEFIKNDLQLLATIAHEQAIAHRIAKYLEEKVREEKVDERYVADCEYNRNGNEVKRVINRLEQVIAIRADIILHSRGTVLEQDNLVAIELKMLPAEQQELDDDRERLVIMTSRDLGEMYPWNGGRLPKYVCGYKLGIYLLFDAKKGLIYQEFYDDGQRREDVEPIDVSAKVEEIRATNKQGYR